MKGTFLILFSFLVVSSVSGQWNNAGSYLNTNDQYIRVFGTTGVNAQLDISVNDPRAGFNLKTKGTGTNSDDYYTFQLRSDFGDVVQSVRDVSASQWNEMFVFDYVNNVINMGDNSLTKIDKVAIGLGSKVPVEALEINGSMLSEEVKVVQDVADYVFDDNYSFLSLEELEKFIDENHHLPNVISQKEVEQNDGQLSLGDFSVSLLEKIEELTLHLIDLNKRVKQLEQENAALKEKIEK